MNLLQQSRTTRRCWSGSIASCEALQREGKVHRAIFKADEGHGFESRANVEELFGAVECFLAEHLRTDGR